MSKNLTETENRRTMTVKGKVINVYLYGDFSYNSMLVLLDEETGKLCEVKTYIERSVAKAILLGKLVEVTITQNYLRTIFSSRWSDWSRAEIDDIKIMQESTKGE